MADTGLSETDLELIVTTVAQNAHVRELLVFGSRAKGTYKKGSDVDLALKGEDLTYGDVVALEAELNEQVPLPYMFDLIDYSHLDNTELKAHIDRVGVQLFSREAKACE